MTSGNDFETRILGTSACYRAQDAVLSFKPGIPESSSGFAVAADGRFGGGEVQIRNPIANRSRAAE